jgi:hypothetical protein
MVASNHLSQLIQDLLLYFRFYIKNIRLMVAMDMSLRPRNVSTNKVIQPTLYCSKQVMQSTALICNHGFVFLLDP